jgi:NAD-dependent SIR2 family protein deacetylase
MPENHSTAAVLPAPDGGPGADARGVDSIAALLEGRQMAVLTGAGVSTDSGIPDYRGEGAPVRTPMTFSQFLDSRDYRKRYWAGSHLGWRRFSNAVPNSGHLALAQLESAGLANGVITQNVDGLHVKAGSARVVDLHGSMNRVRCLECGQLFAREAIAAVLERDNPWLIAPDAAHLGPDGDVVIDNIAAFVEPACTVCGGTLKPDVVFFGEFVPVERFAEARALVQTAELLMIAGSSLVVNSGIRLLEVALRRRIPVVIVNRGATKGDSRATIKLDAGASETLVALAARLAP